MSKKKIATDKPIGVETIKRYIDKHSDFAFEMEILHVIKEFCGEKTRWGGLYFDPNTKKQREFDIQTELPIFNRVYNNKEWVKLAIECKNLSIYYPLVISCTPRTDNEKILDYLHGRNIPVIIGGSIYETRLISRSAFYPAGEYVGRSMDQVGVDKSQEFVTDESGSFDKWSQALASLHSMIEDVWSYNAPENQIEIAFLPVIVVPDNTLWQINYSDDGNVVGEPKQVDSIAYWVDVTYSWNAYNRDFHISHIHFFTKSGLKNFLNGNDGKRKNIFMLYS